MRPVIGGNGSSGTGLPIDNESGGSEGKAAW
ncbi:hypothetical protein EV129_12186 [Rhizobium azibense]|uniref:Uncharacterized protein n=1 Tax=Rhizobium azibense TaxID=1136135 RepID=A0A4R3RDA1_9HYPH|nr:hypothetical protein EV129_12186 [Rhizobium azibense]